MESTLSLTCPALAGAVFLGFRGAEHVSQPYEVELYFTLPEGVSARKAVGERATVRASRRSGAEPLVIHGVIASVNLLHQTSERGLYRALLVPKLWALRHFWRSFVFSFQSIKQFLSTTLADGGLGGHEFRFAIDEGSYPIEELVVQYRETHLAFFHRWLEREGLYYYFEHPEDGANEVLVIVDDKGMHEAAPGGKRARYFPLFGEDAGSSEALHQLQQDVQWLPKSVTIADYNYANPKASVLGEGNVTPGGSGAIREYGYRVFLQGDAQRLADVRAQAIGCREVTLRASGSLLGPRAGYKLSLEDQPDDVGDDWLAIEVRHMGSIAGLTAEVARLTGLSARDTYQISLVAIPAGTQFRAPQTTPWPRIYGFENGVVGGPADSLYAQIDADGRYLVRFEFDTSGLPDAQVSTRIRMMQPHGGSTEGFHFPLRKGTEVMVGFLGGDPDRPFIAGVVPNAQRPSVVGGRNHTQNVIRTGGGNQIVLEDEKGREFIFIHSPKHRTGIYLGQPSTGHASVYTGDGDAQTGTFLDPSNADPTTAGDASIVESFSYLETTEANGGSWIGGDAWENVLGDKSSFVKGNLTAGVRGALTLDVGADSTETYHAKRLTTIKTGREDTVESGGMKQSITGGMAQSVSGAMHQTVSGGMKHDVYGFFSQTVQPGSAPAGGAGAVPPAAPSLNQLHVTGSWLHKVSELNHDDYKTWQTNVAETWTGAFGQDVSLKSETSFKIEAPEAKISATNLKWHIGALTFDYSPAKHEVYVYKGASGVVKTDHAVLYQTAYGVKLDFALVKLENNALYKNTYGAMFKSVGTKVVQKGLATYLAAVIIYNVAFKKI